MIEDWRVWLVRRRAEMKLATRITVAAAVTFLLAHYVGFAQGFWAVLTAIIIMQGSVGGSMKAAFDRLVGTIGGALWGAVVVWALPHDSLPLLIICVIVGVAPLAVLAAFYPSQRVGPVTALIVILDPSGLASGHPIAFTIERVLEVSLGGFVGVVTSLAVFPARAHRVLVENAASLLDQLADWFPMFVREASGADEDAAIERLRVTTRRAMSRLESSAGEAKREQRSWLAEGPDPDPLARTCMRLRNDLVMLSRIAHDRSALPLHPELAPALEKASKEAGAYMRAGAASLRRQKPPPSLADFEAALETYEKEIAAARERSLTRALPGAAVGRLFAVGFALEQIRKNFLDLADRIAELQPKARPEDTSGLPRHGNI